MKERPSSSAGPRLEKARTELKQRVRIEPSPADPGKDRLHVPKPVSTDDFAFLFVPHEQMQIVAVETVKVERFARAFADSAERSFPKAPDFMQYPRNPPGIGRDTPKSPAPHKAAHRLAALQFRMQATFAGNREHRQVHRRAPTMCRASPHGDQAVQFASEDTRSLPRRPELPRSGRPRWHCRSESPILFPRLFSISSCREAVRSIGCTMRSI